VSPARDPANTSGGVDMADVREHPTLFDVVPDSGPGPTCRLCGRPAWRRASGEYNAYCSSGSCTGHQRLCKCCGGTFQVNTDGAGTKYCSLECKRVGYRPLNSPIPRCAWCGALTPRGSRWSAGGPRRAWPYVCSECTSPISHLVSRLRSHHVPHEMARRLLDDPGCEVCHRDIVTKVRNRSTGKVSAPLTVDHDHNCCPGHVSCGLCVRGFLCPQCNSAAGLLGDDPERARLLASYIGRFVDAYVNAR
jgi:hypothetical protein